MPERVPKNLAGKDNPDVYHDPGEVLWKFISLNAYEEIVEKLKTSGLLEDSEIRKLQVATVDLFNSNHGKEVFCGRSKVLLKRLRQQLTVIGHSELYENLSKDVRSAGQRVTATLKNLERQELHSPREQTHITDGVIHIAGVSIEEFSENPDYFSATLKIFNEKTDRFLDISRQSFIKGFVLDENEHANVLKAREAEWNITDLLTTQLLYQQTIKNYKSLSNYEYRPLGNATENVSRKGQALEEAYTLIGKVMRTVAEFSSEQKQFNSEKLATPDALGHDPVEMFLRAAGKELTPLQVGAVRKIALAHVSHGLNSGELTAQLAGSVRTTFPRALIASFNIRSGILHSGAVSECMGQTSKFLESDLTPEEYVSGMIERGDRIYGFGHRIHKTDAKEPPEMLGKDPRVPLYIEACREGFPEKAEKIERLIAYATALRKARPSLGANTDFGASVLFHSLDLSENVAAGFFTAFRSPGVCAQVVNELSIKGNSRRPPFPPVLPYPEQ